MPPFVHRVLTKFSSRAQASVRNVLLICILHPNILTPSTELCCELATYTVRNSWENLPVIETGNFNQRKKEPGESRSPFPKVWTSFPIVFGSLDTQKSSAWIWNEGWSWMWKKPLEFRRFWCFDSPSLIKKNDKAEIKNNRDGQLGGHQRWITFNHVSQRIYCKWHECQRNIKNEQ